jgi:hypothetical protein
LTKDISIIPFAKNKPTMGLNHIPIYEGDEDPKQYWFICEKFWDVPNIIDEEKKWLSLKSCFEIGLLPSL